MAEMVEIGVAGLRHDGGFVREEVLRELQGERWRKTLKNMIDNDPIVGAELFAIEMMIRKVTWQMKAASPSPAHRAAADFVQECLNDMALTWTDTLTEILSFIPWGWAFTETVYKRRDDGKIGWKKWAIRGQDTLENWILAPHGEVMALRQRNPNTGEVVTIPMEKALLFRSSMRKNSPEGVSALRRAYRPWYMKQTVENIEGIGIERDLAGLPMAYVPSKVIKDAGPEYEAWKDIVVNLRNDEQAGVVMPSDRDDNGNLWYDLKLLTTGGQRTFETSTIIERYSRQIAMTLLADFILIGHERAGSFALSADKTDLFVAALGGWLDSIADVIDRHAVVKLLDLNGMDSSDKGRPRIVHSDPARVNLEELGQYIVRLAGSGFDLFSDPEVEAYLRQQGGLPVNKEGTAGIIGKPTPPVGSNGTGPSPQGNTPAAQRLRRDAPITAVMQRNAASESVDEVEAILMAMVRQMLGQ